MHQHATWTIALGLFVVAAGCSDSSRSPAPIPTPQPPGSQPAPQSAAPPPTAPPAPPTTDDLAVLSDDFGGATLSGWQRIFQVEQWGFDQLEAQDLGQTRPGWLTLVPYTSSWYQDWRGILMFKEVTGDMIVTTRVRSTNRADTGAPSVNYSLAGIMVRAPRPGVTPATWTAGGENYVFLSLGAANVPGTFQTEVKTTTDSNSIIEIEQAAGPEAQVRVARIGSVVITLIREETTPWRIHRRFNRTDFPSTLQVGLTVYTDWSFIFASYTPQQHNTTLITGGNPDLQAQFDFVTYARPVVPPALSGRDLTDPFDVPDAELLAFLGN